MIFYYLLKKEIIYQMDKKELEVKQNMVKGLNEVLSKAILDSPLEESYKLIDNIEKETKKKDTTFQTQPFNRDILNFYIKKWEQNTDEILGLRINNFPTIEKALDGVQPGFIVIGADANVGKTGLLISFATDIIKSNDNTFVILVSGDDSSETILSRLIAHTGGSTTINHIKKLGYYKNQQGKEIENIQAAINATFNKLENRIAIYDRKQIKSIGDIEQAIQLHKKEGQKIVVCIDSLLNLEIDTETLDVRMENERRATQSKQLTIDYDIPVITTAELKKPTSKGKEESKPTIHDIAETRKYSFEADAIFLLRNKKTIDQNESSVELEIICDIAKNKLSHIKKEVELSYIVTKSWFREKKPGHTQNDTKKTSYENLSDEELMNTE